MIYGNSVHISTLKNAMCDIWKAKKFCVIFCHRQTTVSIVECHIFQMCRFYLFPLTNYLGKICLPRAGLLKKVCPHTNKMISNSNSESINLHSPEQPRCCLPPWRAFRQTRHCPNPADPDQLLPHQVLMFGTTSPLTCDCNRRADLFCPKHSHELALKRIGRYLKQTSDHRMVMNPSTDICKIDAYLDADLSLQECMGMRSRWIHHVWKVALDLLLHLLMFLFFGNHNCRRKQLFQQWRPKS